MRRLKVLISSSYFIWYIILLSTVIRVIWMFYFNPEIVSDARWYMEKGCNLAHGLGYVNDGIPTANYPIGYPAFLALLFLVGGCKLWIARLANLVLYALILWFFYHLVLDLTKNNRRAAISCLLLAVYPNHMVYVNLAFNETFFLFLFVSALYYLIRSLNGRESFLWISALLWTCAFMTRPAVLFIPFIVLFILFRSNGFKKVFKSWSVIGLVLILLVSPWTIRNYLVFGKFVPVSTNGGFALLIGNNPHAEGRFYLHEDFFRDVEKNSNEAGYSKIAGKMALDYMSSNPVQVIQRIPVKFFYLFWPGMDGISWNMNGESAGKQVFLSRFRFLANGYFVLLMCAFLLAIFMKIINSKWQLIDTLILAMIGYYVLITLVFFGESRYHFHLIPFFHVSVASLFLKGKERFPPGKRIFTS
ncbi:MAG: glycosyltransferase family 39 protein [Bacteroidetes bacterium]|nr:glycosyltransferase family 39 protein [Bacteroidota bacterium]